MAHLSEKKLDHIAFVEWSLSEGGDNTEQMAKLRKAVLLALQEEVSPTERQYILKYFADSMTMEAIANEVGRNKSSVSRGIKRGLDRMAKVLRFADPVLLDAVKNTANARRGWVYG